MNLHQVDDWLSNPLERLIQLLTRRGWIGLATASGCHIELGRPEQLLGNAQLLRDVARHFLRGTIAWRRVKYSSSKLDHFGHHCLKRIVILLSGDLGKCCRASQTDDRKPLTRGGDRAHNERSGTSWSLLTCLCERQLCPSWQSNDSACADSGFHPGSSIHHDLSPFVVLFQPAGELSLTFIRQSKLAVCPS